MEKTFRLRGQCDYCGEDSPALYGYASADGVWACADCREALTGQPTPLDIQTDGTGRTVITGLGI